MAVIHNIMTFSELASYAEATGTFDTIASAVESGAVAIEGSQAVGGAVVIEGGAAAPVISFQDALAAAKAAGQTTAAEVKSGAVTLMKSESGFKLAGMMSMKLPAVAAAAAPLAGVAIGAGLYAANPELATKISETLIPWAHNEDRINAFLDWVNNDPIVLIPRAIVDALKQLFEDEHVSAEEYLSIESAYGSLTFGHPPCELHYGVGPFQIIEGEDAFCFATTDGYVYSTKRVTWRSSYAGGTYDGFPSGWSRYGSGSRDWRDYLTNVPYTRSQATKIMNNQTSQKVNPPTAGVSAPTAPVEPIVWPDTPIIIIPDPLGPDYQPIPVVPITPVEPIPLDPTEPETAPDPTPDKPDEWPEEDPWPVVIPFPVPAPDPEPDDWPEVMPWPLPPERPEEWPTHPEPWEWPEELPWPRTPEEWPDTVPWPDSPPDPESWPEELPWPESPEDWPETVPWPVPWPEGWPETEPWPMKWPDEVPYPIPYPTDWPWKSPDPYPDPREIDDPTKRVDPYIDPWPRSWPYPWPDPEPDPTKPDYPDPYRDPSQPEPKPDPRPDTPEPPNPYPNPPSPVNPLPPVPFIPLPFSGTTGLISVYHPTQQQLLDFAQWLWVTWQDATIEKVWNNPFDGVISLFELYCTPTDVGSKNIRSGFLDSGINSAIISRYTEINCGSIAIPEYYGNYFDYSPYSKCHIYLPFIGIVELNVDDIVGHGVNVTYRIDEYNGSCIAMVTVAKSTMVNGTEVDYSTVMYQFSGNCSVELPFAGGSQAAIKAGMMEAAAWGIGSVIGGVLGGNSLGEIAQGLSYGVARAVNSVVSAKSSVQHSGSFGASYGALGYKKPYIIVTRPKQIQVPNYNELYGYQAHKMIKIGECTGYLRCREVHVISPTANDEEKTKIEELLKSGVYMTE